MSEQRFRVGVCFANGAWRVMTEINGELGISQVTFPSEAAAEAKAKEVSRNIRTGAAEANIQIETGSSIGQEIGTHPDQEADHA